MPREYLGYILIVVAIVAALAAVSHAYLNTKDRKYARKIACEKARKRNACDRRVGDGNKLRVS